MLQSTNDPTILVIFGATGDLTRRKLIPALFHLYANNLLPPLFQIIGFSRRPLNDEKFRKMMQATVKRKKSWSDFSKIIEYRQGTFNDLSSYKRLASKIRRIDKAWKGCVNSLFYLAVPPKFYSEIFSKLSSSGLMQACSPEEGWTRILVEKPFGRDLQSSQKLEKQLSKLFREEQIFRIDHFLGKETIQNILAFRFGNPIFEPLWNKTHIEQVKVKLIETLGLEGRGSFYDRIGALKDVGQNHLLQMAALTAMEPPTSFDPEAVRDERVKIFKSIKCIEPDQVDKYTVRGQYQGYTKEEGVEENSQTETYFKIKFFIENRRWKGVPFVIESGKLLDKNSVEISIHFREITRHLFKHQPKISEQNILRFKVQPEEGIALRLLMKRPGVEMELDPQELSFDYRSSFEERLIEAYEKVLLDCIAGDQMLFARSDGVKSSWEFVTKIVRGWQKNKSPLKFYKPGSSGPSANRMI
jgi:glucose-6-phosphate 1-dehydrogenase